MARLVAKAQLAFLRRSRQVSSMPFQGCCRNVLTTQSTRGAFIVVCRTAIWLMCDENVSGTCLFTRIRNESHMLRGEYLLAQRTLSVSRLQLMGDSLSFLRRQWEKELSLQFQNAVQRHAGGKTLVEAQRRKRASRHFHQRMGPMVCLRQQPMPLKGRNFRKQCSAKPR